MNIRFRHRIPPTYHHDTGTIIITLTSAYSQTPSPMPPLIHCYLLQIPLFVTPQTFDTKLKSHLFKNFYPNLFNLTHSKLSLFNEPLLSSASTCSLSSLGQLNTELLSLLL